MHNPFNGNYAKVLEVIQIKCSMSNLESHQQVWKWWTVIIVTSFLYLYFIIGTAEANLKCLMIFVIECHLIGYVLCSEAYQVYPTCSRMDTLCPTFFLLAVCHCIHRVYFGLPFLAFLIQISFTDQIYFFFVQIY